MHKHLRRLLLATLIIAVAAGATAVAVAGEPADAEVKGMSIPQMLKSATTNVEQMEAQLKESFALLQQSHTEGDLAAFEVRNEAVTAMKGLVKLSEENLLTLQQKATEKDRGGVEHEYVKISIATAKVAELYAQVRSAGGPGAVDVPGPDGQVTYEGVLPLDQSLANAFMGDDVIPDTPPSTSPII